VANDPFLPVNLAAIIEAHPPAAPALFSDGEITSYGDLRRRVAGVRGALSGAGVVPGDRVALLSGNVPAFVVGLFGVLGVGAAAVPLNPLAPPAELGRELAAVRPVAAIVGPGAAVPAGLGLSAVFASEVAPTGTGGRGRPSPGERSMAEAETAGPVPLVERTADDVALLMFTSGTAGLPRAAVLTHGNLLANLAQIQAHPGRQISATDVALGVLPLFHVFGLTVNLCATLAAGGSLVLVPRFDPTETLALCQRFGVTILAGAPPMFAALAAAPAGDGGNPLATVRLALSGAAPLPDRVATDVRIRFGLPLYQGYGLTEASPVVTSAVVDGVPRPGSIGVPLPGVEVRLVDEEGEDALTGDPGEVWVRGANVFPGYWEDPDATSAVLTADGWLRTGDLGVLGDVGNLQLVDRAKDLIIVNGFNVVPAEVENVLLQHPQVADVAVVGESSDRTGEAVRALVVPAPGGGPTLEELAAFAATRLARYKCPTALTVVDVIPRGQAGKVIRRELS
jgi:long-chain acyl-CoA synthetase